MTAQIGTGLLAGQGCALPTRLYVHDDVYDEVVAKVVAAPRLPGRSAIPSTRPPSSARWSPRRPWSGSWAVIDRARSDGATLLTGGTRLGGELADGWFVAPTVFGDVDHDSDLARNEVFGPVQAILRFRTDDEVLAQANDSPFGLGAYLHTRDLGRIQRFVRELEAGTVVGQRDGSDVPRHPVRGLQAERLRARGRSGRYRGDGAAQDGVRGPLGLRSRANYLVTSHPMCL